MCTRCRELLAFRDLLWALETRVAELEELRKSERYTEETFWDTARSQPLLLRRMKISKESVRVEHEWSNDPMVGTFPPR